MEQNENMNENTNETQADAQNSEENLKKAGAQNGEPASDEANPEGVPAAETEPAMATEPQSAPAAETPAGGPFANAAENASGENLAQGEPPKGAGESEAPKSRRNGRAAMAAAVGLLLLFVLAYANRIQYVRSNPSNIFNTQAITRARRNPAARTAQATKGPVNASAYSLREESTPSPAPDAKALFNEDIITIVLMGIDSDKQREAANRGYRSDMICVCAIDVKTNKCTIISIPRDTRARVRRMNNKGEVTLEKNDKINAAFAYGKGPDKYSHQNALEAISALLSKGTSGLELEWYASLDMDGIKPLTDAVGGITLTLPDTIPDVGKKGETLTLNGEKAAIYVRKRHGVTGGSDIRRVRRQQVFLRAFAKQVKLLGIADIPRLWAATNGYVRTNLSLEQIIVLAQQLSKVDIDTAEFIELPGTYKTIKGSCYYIADENGVKEIVEKVFFTQS